MQPESQSKTLRGNAGYVPKKQRALILQGGGALGAYEAGVFKALSERLSPLEDDRQEGGKRQHGNLFDIVAGASAGAINAALIVDHVVRNKKWEGASDVLWNFWQEISTPVFWPDNKWFSNGWQFWENARKWQSDFFGKFVLPNLPAGNLREENLFLPYYFLWPDNLGPLASEEAARRYWSWYQFAFMSGGTPHVLSPGIVQPDFRFNNPYNYLVRYSNAPLLMAIKKHWDYEKHSIKTSYDKNEPRLLFVSVDVKDAITATFDSYEKENGVWKTEYAHETAGDSSDDDNDGRKDTHVIEYEQGLGIGHLLTSISSHLRYRPPDLEATTITEEGRDRKSTTLKKKGVRYFWDGFYLSNTPLREVLQSHRDYWHKIRNHANTLSATTAAAISRAKETDAATVPNLEVYIVDLYPTVERDDFPRDPDGVQNRVGDILYHDKTKYDQKIAYLVTDYIDLANKLIRIAIEQAKDRNTAESEIRDFLETADPKSKKRNGKERKYGDLLGGRFDVEKVVRIELAADDKNDIYGKAFDFSSGTIKQLLDKGYSDALRYV
ncbi:putative esterase of the alpha-beta hydrolase superfamily [Candidatus Nitrososphaera evergladensis SR1]|uniref:Putative esterase of the alpha-beta hydrolase superfamily n=1 Tax=Candidatus Nitrososphaera evergladensis SR1 TaxID=1459636 RepID=A0A075MQR6_9ARCH|nr:patatin-like phospholipase family protein [Candidatus Nitrososphaera evergladensis]AIF83553.1 putative esterase of the alpha-beta hydrolase superfamily [Candidatus Nitrososphaera evergladensis SR1]